MLYRGILSLRRRSLWEAADAGVLLWRRNLGYFIPFFAIPFWVCAFALRFLPGPSGAGGFAGAALPLPWSWFILWWLNPLFDRLILHVAGRRFFEPHSAPRSLLRGLGKSLGRGLAGDLLWRRLSPWRAVMIPLRVLEGEPERGKPGPPSPPGGNPAGKLPAETKDRRWTRKRIQDRKRALSNGGLNFNIFLTVWCFALEWILLTGEAVFVLMTARLFFTANFESFSWLFSGRGLYYFTAWCVNHLLVESLYVCMGFGVYLNSRVEVEGWDLELLFRGLAEGRAKAGRFGKAAALILLCCLGLAGPGLAWAEEAGPGFGPGSGSGSGSSPGPGVQGGLPQALGEGMPAGSLERILRRDLGTEKKTWGLRFKQGSNASNGTSRLENFDPGPLGSWLQRAGAIMLRGALFMGLGALALACAVYAWRRRGKLFKKSRFSLVPAAAPPEPAGPGALAEEASRLYRRGSPREAWALCYAASLEALAGRGFHFPPGATEYRCLALVRRGAGQPWPLERNFAKLIRCWIGLAYGGSLPPEGAFEESLAWVRSLSLEPPRGGEQAPPPGAGHG